MSSTAASPRPRPYKLACEDGRRYLLYRGDLLPGSPDHEPGRWYFHAYPASWSPGPGRDGGYATAEEAEEAARGSRR